ncbi:MAG: PEPxxWA-CTERM sorting domain-containing protein [Sphingomonadales bacterium]
MRKYIIGLAALCAATSANAAVFVSYMPGASAAPAFLSTMVENFESYAVGASIGPNAKIYNTTVPNDAAVPGFNSTGNYAAVLGLPTAGSYTKAFTAANIFSFVIGSLDNYNTLTLSFNDGSTEILSGAQIAFGATANGNQSLPSSNGRVVYVSNGVKLINGATFSSTNNSFEFDNLMTGNVPEPSTWAMMVLGFGIVGRAMRRRRSMTIASFA